MAQVIGASEAVGLIRDHASVYFGGSGGGHAVPQALIQALRGRFAAGGTPRGLTIASSVSIGDWDSTGFNLLADPKLVRRVISGGFNNCPKIAALAIADEIEDYNFPPGALAALFCGQ